MAKGPFVPSGRGRAAVAELDRVDWGELAHAYGRGVTGQHLLDDVRATLARLGDPGPDAMPEAVYALTCNIYHQGTIYEATAPAVPFLAAVMAGPELWIGHARELVCLIGSIAISSSWETSDGSMSGSYGEDVSESTRLALHASRPLLRAAADLHAPFSELVDAIDALVCADPPKRAHLDAVAEHVDALYEVDYGDPPRDEPPRAEEWVAHAKFGTGLVLRRGDGKVHIRFTDGTERTLAERFVTPSSRPR